MRSSGGLRGFDFFGDAWGLEPKTAFYDWLYMKALSQHPELAARISGYAAFSDIEFNPKKSMNCQARSVALFVSLHKRDMLEHALYSKSDFLYLLSTHDPSSKLI